MKEVTKTVTVYMVGDKEFISKNEAEAYEKKLKKRLDFSYYRVRYKPDLTEGRGYYKAMIVATLGTRNSVYQYLVKHVGDPLAFVMGVEPMDNWIVNDKKRFDDLEELDRFLSEKVSVGIGDYIHPIVPEVVYLDDSGKRIDPDTGKPEVAE
jgi:hypothetical protein